MFRKTTTSVLAVAAASVLASACGTGPGARGATDGDRPGKLVFAAVPSEQTGELRAAFAPITAALEKDLGTPVEFQPVASNAAVVEAQVAKRVDVAVYGAFSYHLARSRAQVEPVAVPVQAPEGEPGAHAYGVTRGDDTSITSLKDVKGKDICFTDPGSTTGYLQPLASLKEAGVDVAKDAETVFTKGHDTAVASLLAGDCDIAFVGDIFIDQLLPARGQLKPGQVRKVWTSPLIPGPPVVVGSWLPQDVRTKITKALTGLTATDAAAAGLCEGKEIKGPPTWKQHAGAEACPLGASNAWTFITANDATYAPIARICDITKAKVCTSGD
ncbi:phosphate/phosphite/phosphonate ABC transporter substrate-binding protein [Actinomadura bangladeshensis]|uniref:Phosphate/phosphite/phosphonate ABC transporter substrate-binding protein n=1 Tax=Actinomadura bangladeshensis TaxID=453573 RepID=A0A4R4PCP4_9ACTN|nr:phosphate/phosphite/phosphonate ABC transporter substrate-binding protein [Actinomadura bangladeshensis]TDC18192.1 phosphate/phosphite/phosphonate ABC transporter substrate-binding protein [Actinomadura bangladeshensis]